mmetsp:Transcript_4183/g.14311  ORF Transcript_4183/g.14311 Transcript_4183/m.14311 type:complete len:99 (+) Transcript_4183:682-978(+)
MARLPDLVPSADPAFWTARRWGARRNLTAVATGAGGGNAAPRRKRPTRAGRVPVSGAPRRDRRARAAHARPPRRVRPGPRGGDRRGRRAGPRLLRGRL